MKPEMKMVHKELSCYTIYTKMPRGKYAAYAIRRVAGPPMLLSFLMIFDSILTCAFRAIYNYGISGTLFYMLKLMLNLLDI